MKLKMRQKLAREPFAEKIRKVGQLIRLAKNLSTPQGQNRPDSFFREMNITDARSKQFLKIPKLKSLK
jgi:hypothetical protein